MSKRIHIYKAEKEAGLDKLIRSTASICYASKLELNETPKVVPTIDNLPSRVVAQNENQVDLHYLKTIMVSSGWNLNDDVFHKSELWAARATPEDKPFNFQHVQNDIIGHITACQVVNDKYEAVADDTTVDSLPDPIHILTNAVLYKFWADDALQKRMDKILAEIVEGKWFVSMEALFTGFDYAVIQPDGTQLVVARNEQTAFLTKHLRAYKGSGEYEGNKVGRLMRNLVFSGKGLVENPANPPSVILPAATAFVTSGYSDLSVIATKNNNLEKNVVYENPIDNKPKEENLMADTLEKKVAELEKSLADAQKNADEVTASKAAVETKVKELETANTSLAKELNDAKVALKASTDELAKIKAAETRRSRIDTLVAELAYEKDFAAEVYDTVAVNLNDEAFAKYVATMKKTVKTKADTSTVPVDDKTVDPADTKADKTDLDKVVADKQPTMSVVKTDKDVETVQAHVAKYMSLFNNKGEK